MTTSNVECRARGCRVEVPAGFTDGACVDHYLEECSHRLNATTLQFHRGESVDDNTLEWLLDQVEFIIETVGDDTVSLSDTQRSRLLELLLNVANLTEYIRRHPAHSALMSLHRP